MIGLIRLALATILLGLAAPSIALPQASGEAPEESAGDGPAIDADQDSSADERIQRRIGGIFTELPALEGITVTVEEGVVTLEGLVPTVEDRDRAQGIAERVSGVVTVENRIERDVSVDKSLEGLGGLSDLLRKIVAALPLIGVALAIAVVIGAVGYGLASLSGLWARLAPNSFLAELIASAIRFAFVLGGIVVALNMLGAGTLLGAVLGGAGVIGIALGFALRDTVENYVASLMMSVRQPFRANDHVVIDSHEGRVIRLTSRATILMTLDGNHLRLPNAQVFKAVILNYTRNPQRRFEFDIGIDAEDDPTAARHLGVNVLKALDFVLDHPEPQGRVVEVGDSNIVLRFLGWIDQRETDWYKAKSRAIPAVMEALEDAGFGIPEPIYRLRFDSGAALPLEGVQASQPAPESRPRRKVAHAVDEDTAPESEVANMVEAERASPAAERDLLDSSRPVE